MASNGAAQTAQAQQGNQQQAEQFLQQQQQQAFNNLRNYMAQNPNPVSQWAPLQGPQAQGGQVLGGGQMGPNGPISAPPPGPPHRIPMTMHNNLAGGTPGGTASNPFMKMLGPDTAAHGSSGANSSATQAQMPAQVQGAAQANPQLAAYLQAWQAMQAKNQTQMHGGGIG